jgi:hypothetical protein
MATDPTVTLTDRLHVLLTLFLITQTRAPNIPLFLFLEVQRRCFSHILPAPTSTARSNSLTLAIAFTSLLLSQTTYFAFGGSNSISSIDLGNAYNGVANYNIAAVGVLLFASNWAGAVWWCSAAVTLLLPRPHIESPAPTKASTATSDNTKNKSRAFFLHHPSLNSVRPILTPPTAGPSTQPPRQLSPPPVWSPSWPLALCCAHTCLSGLFSRRSICMLWLGRWAGICLFLLGWGGCFGGRVELFRLGF